MVRLQPGLNYRRRLFFLCLALLTAITQISAQSSALVKAGFFEKTAITQKVFPLLELLQRNKQFRKIIDDDTAFQRIIKQQVNQVRTALDQCQNVACYADCLQWSDREMRCVGDEMVNLYNKKRKFRGIVSSLRKEKVYSRYDSLPDTAFLRNSWYNTAKGLNYILDIYIKGQTPQYPKIDAISFGKADSIFRNQLTNALTSFIENTGDKSFFNLSLQMSMTALSLNGRDEAVRYEPLSSGLNQLPLSGVKKTNWQAYPYSMILVPGLGPEGPGISLDSGGAKRCQYAASLYQQKLAPFIIVSGGHVHPNKTPYCEAVEMKKYLVERLNVPANAIFIEPYARHTTTNIRNVSRMIYWFGIPFSKPVLIATDNSQNDYINQGMSKTCMRDLGYLPYQKMKRLNEKQTEFFPVLTSLQVNPFDPLDP